MTDRTASILYYVLIAGIVACGVGSGFYLYFEYAGWPTWLTDLAPMPKATASVTVAGIELAATVTREDNFFYCSQYDPGSARNIPRDPNDKFFVPRSPP